MWWCLFPRESRIKFIEWLNGLMCCNFRRNLCDLRRWTTLSLIFFSARKIAIFYQLSLSCDKLSHRFVALLLRANSEKMTLVSRAYFGNEVVVEGFLGIFVIRCCAHVLKISWKSSLDLLSALSLQLLDPCYPQTRKTSQVKIGEIFFHFSL